MVSGIVTAITPIPLTVALPTTAQTVLTGNHVTCGGGCDRVFTEAAVIPARDDAAQMWAQGHLPHVGPTLEGAPILPR